MLPFTPISALRIYVEQITVITGTEFAWQFMWMAIHSPDNQTDWANVGLSSTGFVSGSVTMFV